MNKFILKILFTLLLLYFGCNDVSPGNEKKEANLYITNMTGMDCVIRVGNFIDISSTPVASLSIINGESEKLLPIPAGQNLNIWFIKGDNYYTLGTLTKIAVYNFNQDKDYYLTINESTYTLTDSYNQNVVSR